MFLLGHRFAILGVAFFLALSLFAPQVHAGAYEAELPAGAPVPATPGPSLSAAMTAGLALLLAALGLRRLRPANGRKP